MPLRRPSAVEAAPTRHTHAGPPGIDTYMRGCRCAPCVDSHTRATKWVEQLTDGLTIDVIAERDETSPDPAEIRRATRLLAQSAAVVPWLAQPADASSGDDAGQEPCVSCGQPFAARDRRRRYHPGACERVGKALRYHVDDGSRLATQTRKYRHIVERRPGTPEAAAAERWLASPTAQRKRTIHRGSAAWEAAVHAYEHRWPVFDQLPEAVRQTVSAARGQRRER